QTTLNVPGGEDPDSTQRAAYERIAEKFGEGAQDPLVVLARKDDVETALPDVRSVLSDLDNVATVIPSGVSDSGDVALVTVMSDYGPLDARTTQLVRDIRAADSTLAGAELLVTGATAIGLDSDEQLHAALSTYIALIVG